MNARLPIDLVKDGRGKSLDKGGVNWDRDVRERLQTSVRGGDSGSYKAPGK